MYNKEKQNQIWIPIRVVFIAIILTKAIGILCKDVETSTEDM